MAATASVLLPDASSLHLVLPLGTDDPHPLNYPLTDTPMTRAYYSAALNDFIRHAPEHILGALAAHHQFALEGTQRDAWLAQIEILKLHTAAARDGYILFEYAIPRIGKRVDAVLLTRGVVFVMEFKVGDKRYASHALDQALDYALDLKNFHEGSRHTPVVPIVIATEADAIENKVAGFPDGVFAPLKANRHNLGAVVANALESLPAPPLNPVLWRDSAYRPTPTIVEAAQALYRGHGVRDISRSDAGAINLSLTADAIAAVIDEAKAHRRKSVCFVTGVPGAGKTLAGLNIANERLRTDQDEHAVFLSGNGPLVKVLREALARDERGRSSPAGGGGSKKSALSKVEAFVQNIHHFRDDALVSRRPPLEKVVIFDEAQRAWTLEQTSKFMKTKRKVQDFAMSEPQFLISVMDRHEDWAVVVCLVGGGQEINTGEAGLVEWLTALKHHFPHWRVYLPPNLNDDEYTGGQDALLLLNPGQYELDGRLHLATSIRSYRAEKVSALVKAVLDADVESAQALREATEGSYPIVITRDLNAAKRWVKARARGTERYGLLASSGAARLRPLGINVQAKVDVVHWFLNGKADVRSSYFLEEAATEFDVQGLELDWTCVMWDADLRYADGGWAYKSFRGTGWHNINNPARMKYLKNAYRVLLTRARQGMVIVVPEGCDEDWTREPAFYNGTYAYLRRVGFRVI